MEILVDILSLDNRLVSREQPNNQIRNRNFRRPLGPQIRQREQRDPINQGDHQLRPPFPENFVVEYDVEYPEDEVHHFDNFESKIYLEKQEKDKFYEEQDCSML